MFSRSQIAERQSFFQRVLSASLCFSTTYDRGGCSKGAVGIEEKMKNDDLIMYLTFHPQMVDNAGDFEPCSKPEF